ncbi:hypothetical protein GJQ57_13650 [Ralstonia pickettii]|uniref:Uncharacterized protein n=1 Tax=Ralstonia pickettii TaxID=329 RepID=A0A7X2HNC0_RALPI|nr:hypothetical protein [Ralstonia pickettii]MRS99690.1 hypothetical protein [Ralstonia pickettii]
MNIKDVVPTLQAEAWVKAAFAKQSEVGGGSFALVLDAEDAGYVVKLTRSEADYAALVHFSGTSPHFPKVIKHGVNQGQGDDGSFHALLMEKLPKISPPKAGAIADHINAQMIGKHHPHGLLATAIDLRTGKVRDEYPDSLADALQTLGRYAADKMLRVELNQRANWGQRADGTLVIFDLAHSRKEM